MLLLLISNYLSSSFKDPLLTLTMTKIYGFYQTLYFDIFCVLWLLWGRSGRDRSWRAEWCLLAVKWDRVSLETDINVISALSSLSTISSLIGFEFHEVVHSAMPASAATWCIIHTQSTHYCFRIFNSTNKFVHFNWTEKLRSKCSTYLFKNWKINILMFLCCLRLALVNKLINVSNLSNLPTQSLLMFSSYFLWFP